MYKNLKWSYIVCFILSVVVIAWRTLANFFGGVGINFIALLVVVAVLLTIFIFDKETRSRMRDLFIICCAFAVLESVVYFPYEFGACFNPNVAVVFFNFQNVYSFLGILFLAYLAFRFILETQNIRLTFIEVLLGNRKFGKGKIKPRSNNGLSEKPNANEEQEVVVENDNDEM